MTEFDRKMKEEMKAIQSEIKENIQGTNNDREETGTQINDLEQKEEINISDFKKLYDFFQRQTIHMIFCLMM